MSLAVNREENGSLYMKKGRGVLLRESLIFNIRELKIGPLLKKNEKFIKLLAKTFTGNFLACLHRLAVLGFFLLIYRTMSAPQAVSYIRKIH